MRRVAQLPLAGRDPSPPRIMETYAAGLHALDSDDHDRLRTLVDADPGLGLARDAAGLSLVLQACYRRRPAGLDVLLAPALELDLFAAAAVGDAARARKLLESDPALLEARAENRSDLRAMHAAVAGGSAVILSALHAAAHHGRADLVGLLLEHGADATLVTDEGKLAALWI